MPEIPLSSAPRHVPRLLPAGVAVETLAAAKPSQATLERARELAAQVGQGDHEESLLELRRHAGQLQERPPALELVLEAVLDSLLPELGALDDYAGRLFFCLALADSPAPRPLRPEARAGLRELAREGLAQKLHQGPEAVAEAARAGLGDGALGVLLQEAAQEVSARGAGWVLEHWLLPLRFDYVIDKSAYPLTLPPVDELTQALAGWPRLLEADDDKLQLMRVQMVKHYVLPRLLAGPWRPLLAAAEGMIADEPLLANRQDFADVVQEARRLVDEAS